MELLVGNGSTADRAVADLIGLARDRMLVAGLSTRTAAEYTEEAERYVRWFSTAHGREPRLEDLTVASADQFVLALKSSAEERGRAWSKGTQGHVGASLAGFGRYLGQSLQALTDSGTKVTLRRPTRQSEDDDGWPFEPDGLTDDEIAALFRSLDPTNPYDVVTRAIIALGLEDGPRTSELTRIEVEDVCDEVYRGQAIGPSVRILRPAKTSPKRVLPVGVVAEEMIRAAVGARTSGPLFPGRFGQPLTVSALRDRVADAGVRVGLELCPQRLRRSAASAQATHGASSAQLDAVFGWAPDPRDVKGLHYTRPRPDQLFYAHQSRLSPLDRAEDRLVRAGKAGLR